jgi:hypothetical protein
VWLLLVCVLLVLVCAMLLECLEPGAELLLLLLQSIPWVLHVHLQLHQSLYQRLHLRLC